MRANTTSGASAKPAVPAGPIETRRGKSDATRRRLIEATIEAIASRGLQKTTIAIVAQISGLSPGLVGFHFRNKNQLVMESLAHLIEKWRAGWVRIAANGRLSPVERLRAILDREFSPTWCNQRTVAIWYGFWGGVPTQPTHRQLCHEAEQSQTVVLADHFRLLIREGGYQNVDPDAAAQGLSALMKGMYLNYGFDLEHFDRRNAKRVCISYLAGLFPQHFSPPWKQGPRPVGRSGYADHLAVAGRPRSSAKALRDNWAVTAEYGRLRDALVAPPGGQVPAIAPRISKAVFYGGALASEAGIRSDHGRLRDALVAAGVRVHTLSPDPQLALQTCVQDIGFMTPFGAVIAPSRDPLRSGETVPLLQFYESAGAEVWHTVNAGAFDGSNAVLVRPGAILIGCSAGGEGMSAAAQLSHWFDQEGWETRLVLLPQPYRRLDSLLAVLSQAHVLLCRDLLAAEIVDWIEQHGFEPIQLDHALDLQGGGFLCLGDGKVLASSPSSVAAESIHARGLELIDVNVQSLNCLGIGLRQLVQSLNRDPVKQ